MSNEKPPDSKADALAKQLKDQLAQRRPTPWKLVLASIVIASTLLGLMAWWMYPRPKPALLQVMALDAVCTPDDTPRVRAQLLVAPDDTGPRRLTGHKLLFHDSRLLLPADGKPRQIEALSDERGEASVEWALRNPASTEFHVLYVDPANAQASPVDVGRIFVWPKDAPILIVDADETLISKDLDAKASEILMKAAKEDWKVVYVAPAHQDGHEFRKARRWIVERQAKLPFGPVLGRKHFADDETPEAARAALLKELKATYTGPMFAVVKLDESARVSQEAGLRTVKVGAGPAPANVLLAATWADVPITRK